MTPELSIVILTRNSLGVVQRLIEAIRAQEFHLPFELIFMENNSSDGTLEYLQAIRDMPVRIIPVGEGKFSHSGTRMAGGPAARPARRWFSSPTTSCPSAAISCKS